MPGGSGRVTEARVTEALRHRDYALLWGGQAVSLAGNGIFTVALPLEVLRLTGSGLDLGLVVSARTVPAVLLLLAGGTIVDRISRRLVMLISDIVCGVAVGLVAALIAAGHDELWQIAALSAVFGVASAFFKPAATAIVKDILPAGLLMSASSLSSLSQSLAQYLLGPAVGGIIVAVTGPSWAFGLDAISFAVSAACLALMRARVSRPAGQQARLVDGMREGLRYCRSQAWLWWTMIAVGLANLVCYVPLMIMEALLVSHVFHAGAVALGLMYAASGAGGALASVLAARRPPRRRVTVVVAVWAASGLVAIVMGLAPWLWLAVAAAGVTWAGITYGNVVWLPLLQQEVPPDLIGRASSVDWMISIALAPLGIIAGGAVADLIGVRLTLLIGGTIALAMAAVLLIPGVTEPDRRPLVAPEPMAPAPAVDC